MLMAVLIIVALILVLLVWSHFTKPGQAELQALELNIRTEINRARAEIGNLKSKLRIK